VPKPLSQRVCSPKFAKHVVFTLVSLLILGGVAGLAMAAGFQAPGNTSPDVPKVDQRAAKSPHRADPSYKAAPSSGPLAERFKSPGPDQRGVAKRTDLPEQKK